MGIIAWIVLGLGAGLLANMLIPGRRSQGLIITCVIGIAGALLGGWLATKLFHVDTLHGFFNLSTWLTAIVGAAILLLAYHLVTSRSSPAAAAAAAVSAAAAAGHAGGRTGKHPPDLEGPVWRTRKSPTPGRFPLVRITVTGLTSHRDRTIAASAETFDRRADHRAGGPTR